MAKKPKATKKITSKKAAPVPAFMLDLSELERDWRLVIPEVCLITGRRKEDGGTLSSFDGVPVKAMCANISIAPACADSRIHLIRGQWEVFCFKYGDGGTFRIMIQVMPGDAIYLVVGEEAAGVVKITRSGRGRHAVGADGDKELEARGLPSERQLLRAMFRDELGER